MREAREREGSRVGRGRDVKESGDGTLKINVNDGV